MGCFGARRSAVVLEPTDAVLEPTAVVLEPTAIVSKPTAVVLESTASVLEPTGIVLEFIKGAEPPFWRTNLPLRRTLTGVTTK